MTLTIKKKGYAWPGEYVWLFVLENKHVAGMDGVTVYATREAAEQAMVDYVEENWSLECCDEEHGPFTSHSALEAVEIYKAQVENYEWIKVECFKVWDA